MVALNESVFRLVYFYGKYQTEKDESLRLIPAHHK